jgi:hypothetical protein
VKLQTHRRKEEDQRDPPNLAKNVPIASRSFTLLSLACMAPMIRVIEYSVHDKNDAMLQGTTTYINITSPHLLQTTLKYF